MRIWLISFLLVSIVLAGSVKAISGTHLVDKNLQGSFPVTHWIMLGLSETGGYNKQDVSYTTSFSTKEEKRQANITEIKKRIKNRKIVGMAKLLEEKLCRVYGEGDDNFTQQKKYSENQTMLYNYMYGEKNAWFLFYCKVFRIFVLGCIILQMFFLLREKKTDDTFVYALTLFGSLLFFILWEANNKYSISFEYVMLLLAADAIGKVKEHRCKTIQNKIISYGIAALFQFIITIIFFVVGWNNYAVEQRIYQHDLVDIQKEKASSVITDVAGNNVKLEQSFLANSAFDHLELYISKKDLVCETIYQVCILDEKKRFWLRRRLVLKANV